jgi:hypothetical protein
MVDTAKAETAIAKRPTIPNIQLSSSGALMPSNLAEAIEYAKMIAHSGMVPKQYDGNVGAVLVAIQMGAEVGLPPLASIQNIAVINGRPSLWGDAVLAVVKSQPDCIDVIETEGEGWAQCIVKRRGHSPVECKWTTQDAKTAGLWGKSGPWTQYPRRMLQMRARGFACRDAYPDRLRGISIAEESRDIPEGVDPNGVVEASLEAGDHSFGFIPKKPAELSPTQVAAAIEKTAEQVMAEKDREFEATESKKSKRGQQSLPANEREPGAD